MKQLTKKQKHAPRKAAVMLLAVVLALLAVGCGKQAGTVQQGTLNEEGALVIPVSEITNDPQFYALTVNDTEMQVIAVRAPDGTIRTAFNTCQVCYSSGRGYYQQDGDVLVCQNCGNRFAMDRVEVESGGCNPWPIFDDYKTTDDEQVVISAEYLQAATVLFANWKTAV